MDEEKVVKMPGICFRISNILISFKIADNLMWTRTIRPTSDLYMTESVILDFHLESWETGKGFRLIIGPISFHVGMYSPKKEE